MSVLLTDDETIHGLNQQYRDKDKPTDVLSFPLLEPETGSGQWAVGSRQSGVANRAPSHSPGNPKSKIQNPKSALRNVPIGDVVISVETAARQADKHGMSLDAELALLITHGILHLLGYDDSTEEAMLEMEARERALGVRP